MICANPNRAIRHIVTLVSEYYGVPVTDLLGPKKYRQMVSARAVCVWLARELTDMTYQQIGHAMNRDHSTIMSAHGIALDKFLPDPERKMQMEILRNDLKSGQFNS